MCGKFALDSSDNILAVDRNNHRVQKFDSSGNYLDQWGQSPSVPLDMVGFDSAGQPGTVAQVKHSPPSLERALGVPEGRWWANPETAQKLALSADQTRKMDDALKQFRLKQIDLQASVKKEKVIMEFLLGVEPPDETKVVSHISAIARAREEMEIARVHMLFEIRRLLTPEQLNKLAKIR